MAVVAGDAVSSLEGPEFLRRADQGCQDGQRQRQGLRENGGYPLVMTDIWKITIFHGKTYYRCVFSIAVSQITGG